jgi:hypothetical protein
MTMLIQPCAQLIAIGEFSSICFCKNAYYIDESVNCSDRFPTMLYLKILAVRWLFTVMYTPTFHINRRLSDDITNDSL